LDDSISLLEKLVSIPSPSGVEGEASAWLTGWMCDHGFDARVDAAGNAVGMRGNGLHRIVLLGHIDTFPGELPVRREGDWLCGRGVVDAKGPLCTFVAAAAAVDVPPGWQLVVVGAVEEEAATSRGARHLIQTLHQAIPDMCIIGEPGGWDRIALGYKGRLLVDLKLRAPFAHSAGEARLPAEQAVDLWNRLVAYCADLNADRQKAFDRLDPSLRHIVTGDDGAYGTVEMSLGFRLPPGLSPDTLAQELQKLLLFNPQPPAPSPQPLAPSLQPPASSHLTFSGAEVAFRAGKNTPLVRAFLASIREQGGEARFVLKTGTSDMNVVGPAWNCPICAYGPGDSKLDHTPEECINLSEYLRSIGVLESALSALMDTRTGNRE
jgi:LysW-gamma-L-lysine carboxypeptidase